MGSMPIPFTLVLSMAAGLCSTMCIKLFAKKCSDGIGSTFVFNCVAIAAAAIVLLIWGGFGATSLYTTLLGVLFGAAVTVQGVSNLLAFRMGPVSYTTVIVSCSTIVTALSGLFFFDESIAWPQIVGIVLMLASFILAARSENEEQKSANLRWMGMCLICFMGSGSIGLMQKFHQTSVHKEELNAFLITAFLVASVLSGIVAFVFLRKERGECNKSFEDSPSSPLTRNALLLLGGIMLVDGLCVAANHKFNLFLSGVIPSAIFFPLVNGGNLVLCTVAAMVFFRERLTKTQWVGLIIGMASVIFLCNPFGA